MTSRKRRTKSQSVESTEAVYSEGTSTPRNEDVKKEQHRFEDEPAFVRASVGMTYNLGNYESLRVDAAITMPCVPGEVEKCHEVISAKAYRLMSEELDRCLGGENKKDA